MAEHVGVSATAVASLVTARIVELLLDERPRERQRERGVADPTGSRRGMPQIRVEHHNRPSVASPHRIPETARPAGRAGGTNVRRYVAPFSSLKSSIAASSCAIDAARPRTSVGRGHPTAVRRVNGRLCAAVCVQDVRP
jgi:hypothetical protein